ncbi:MAG TPA: amidohydrolase family protein, partial [Chitinophagaceae bacterium]|nr:amidohydrolase family protein [Chitinophagaceae bacterium]
MQRIDAHQHFWMFDPVRDNWITSEMSILQSDFLPRDLKPILQQENFYGSVLVQSEQSEKANEWMLQLAAENTFIKGIVGWVDLQAENIEERLAHYIKFRIIKGFRHILQGEDDKALMLKPHFLRGIKALKKYDFTYDILIYPDQLQYAIKLVEQFPEQLFVLDHLAKPYIKSGEIEVWKKDIINLAQFENVYCKISGMVTEGDWKLWKGGQFFPYLNVVAETF